MRLSLTKEAVAWYKREMALKKGDYVRLFVRYGGLNGPQNGFSLGVAVASPGDMGMKVEHDGIIFYVERDDLWFFNDVQLQIDYDNSTDNIDFIYNGVNEE